MSKKANLTVGTAVKTLRKRAGWSQGDLAQRAGFEHHQIVSAIETGVRALKAAELHCLARLFHVEVNDLLRGLGPSDEVLVLWREGSTRSSSDETEALFLQRCRKYALVERLAQVDEDVALPEFPVSLGSCNFDTIGKMAEQVRNSLQLGAIPGPALRAALENTWRIKIFEVLLGAGSGATTRGEFGPAILENAGEPPKRRVFSLAHELFHVLTWKSISMLTAEERTTIHTANEQSANVFASALLLPQGPVLEATSQLQAEQLGDFLPLAQRFSVSLPALLWRLVNLHILNRTVVQDFLNPEYYWGSTDPGWEPPRKLERPLPQRYVILAFSTYLKGRMTIGKLAELLETSVGMVEWRLTKYGLDLEADAYQAEVFSA